MILWIRIRNILLFLIGIFNFVIVPYALIFNEIFVEFMRNETILCDLQLFDLDPYPFQK